MKCRKCGKRLSRNEKFCTVCGYYNDEKLEDNFNPEEADLLNENWYDDEIKLDDDDVEIELDDDDDDDIDLEEEPVNKEKPKEKPKKEKQKKEKKEKVKEEKPKKEKSVYSNEKYLEAYIGEEDYNVIKNKKFNIYAFLLNWIYFLYRKLYISGIIGLIITSLVAFFLTKFFLIYVIICIIVLGFVFNPYYIFVGKKRVEKTLQEFEGSDTNTLKDECRKRGGVNTIYALIIYFVFVIIIILALANSSVSLNKNHNPKFFNENSENKATCISLIKVAYREEASNYNDVDKAICQKDFNNNEYKLYLKFKKDKKDVYVFYETSKGYIMYNKDTGYLETLNSKTTLTGEELKLKNELNLIVSNYKNGVSKAKEEDELIKKKTNTKAKKYFIFNRNEIIR